MVSNHKKLYDFVPVLIGWALSKRAIDLIESIEPGVHQYLPLDLRMKDGSPSPEPCWLLNICSRIESPVAEEFSNCQRVGFPEDYWRYGFGYGPKKLAVHKSKIAGRAIWTDRRFDQAFVSDQFWNAMQTLGLKGLTSDLPVTEV
jgi:hypothetical protein